MCSKEIKTIILKVDPDKPDLNLLKQAAEEIKAGGTCVFPTETVYGIGSNALDVKAVLKIFEAKGRPQDNPLIVHISSLGMLEMLVEEAPDAAVTLAEEFWPGPLTLVLKKSENVSDVISAGLDTVAIRMPSHPVARNLIDLAELPIAAPSANLSGRPSPTSFLHAFEDMCGRVDVMIDGDSCELGVESTVVDVTGDTPMVLRPGGISLERLKKVISNIELYPFHSAENLENVMRSPGLKHRHYAPASSLFLIDGEYERQVEIIRGRITRVMQKCSHETLGLLLSTQTAKKLEKEMMILSNVNAKEADGFTFLTCCEGRVEIVIVKDREDMKMVAHSLFAALRAFGIVDEIISETFDESGEGLAVMNRLKRASGGKLI